MANPLLFFYLSISIYCQLVQLVQLITYITTQTNINQTNINQTNYHVETSNNQPSIYQLTNLYNINNPYDNKNDQSDIQTINIQKKEKISNQKKQKKQKKNKSIMKNVFKQIYKIHQKVLTIFVGIGWVSLLGIIYLLLTKFCRVLIYYRNIIIISTKKYPAVCHGLKSPFLAEFSSQFRNNKSRQSTIIINNVICIKVVKNRLLVIYASLTIIGFTLMLYSSFRVIYLVPAIYTFNSSTTSLHSRVIDCGSLWQSTSLIGIYYVFILASIYSYGHIGLPLTPYGPHSHSTSNSIISYGLQHHILWHPIHSTIIKHHILSHHMDL